MYFEFGCPVSFVNFKLMPLTQIKAIKSPLFFHPLWLCTVVSNVLCNWTPPKNSCFQKVFLEIVIAVTYDGARFNVSAQQNV